VRLVGADRVSSAAAVRRPARVPELTAGQARRIAIAAQQLAGPPRPPGAPVNRGHLRRLLDAIGLLQIDSVNVLARAHYLPVFARLGGYPRSLLDSAAWPSRPADRMLLETWAHVASLVPVTVEPLLRWRRRRGSIRWLEQHSAFADDVLALIAERGPLSAGDIERELAAPGPGRSGWGEWSQTKHACELLFADGVIGTAYRRGFERCYDLLERIVPAPILAVPTPAEADAKRALVELAVRHHGIGTAGDLADYYRLYVADTKAALADLIEAGTVQRVAVRGWREPAYLHADARIPRRVAGRALLCPFDPLIWERDRTERLFGVRYRIEIYTPAAKRVHGYYVFPLLVGETIAGRFDLKADRADRRLLVQAAWTEPGGDPGTAVVAAVQELRRMADWLDLDDIAVAERGDLAAKLRRQLAGPAR
jgi:uncharacterized protein YcaQ